MRCVHRRLGRKESKARLQPLSDSPTTRVLSKGNRGDTWQESIIKRSHTSRRNQADIRKMAIYKLRGSLGLGFAKHPKLNPLTSYEDLGQPLFKGKTIASKQNTLRIQWRYITSSKGMESPRRISWRDTKKKSWTFE
ncbi:hypothetical protein Tco_0784914 [Tanacetum coccineum]